MGDGDGDEPSQNPAKEHNPEHMDALADAAKKADPARDEGYRACSCMPMIWDVITNFPDSKSYEDSKNSVSDIYEVFASKAFDLAISKHDTGGGEPAEIVQQRSVDG